MTPVFFFENLKKVSVISNHGISSSVRKVNLEHVHVQGGEQAGAVLLLLCEMHPDHHEMEVCNAGQKVSLTFSVFGYMLIYRSVFRGRFVGTCVPSYNITRKKGEKGKKFL